MAALVSGAVFGAAMGAAGFHDPAVVVEQLKFTDWHMLQVFLVATASSSVIYNLAERSGILKLAPRTSSPLGFVAQYDGNIVGGAMLGAGMALSGSCPGTLFAQLAVGVQSGFFALLGALIGGIVWTGYVRNFVMKQRQAANIQPEVDTLYQRFGFSQTATLLLLETLYLSVITVTMLVPSSPRDGRASGPVGGFLVGLAQLISLITRSSLIGISGSYEEAGHAFWWLMGGLRSANKPASCQNMIFAAGVAAGAWTLARAGPGLPTGSVFKVPSLQALVGGMLMVVGSRVAGGCTSGHGISGMSLQSTSSFVTIASVFASGAIVALFLY